MTITEHHNNIGGNVPCQLTSISIRLATDAGTGWDLSHSYVEQFWLPAIGTTSTLMLRFIGRHVESSHYKTFDIIELATCLGLGTGGFGRNSPVAKTFKRLGRFRLASIDSDDMASDMLVTVTSRVPEVPIRLRSKWPEHLRILHARTTARHHLDVAKEKAS